MTQPYDGLPLNTPTKITALSIPGDIDVFATRTADGGSIEYRPVVGGPTDLRTAREVRLTQASAALRTMATNAAGTTVTSGNTVAVLQGVVNNLAVFCQRLADLLDARNGIT